MPDNYTRTPLTQDRNGAIWAGTGRKGVVKIDSNIDTPCTGRIQALLIHEGQGHRVVSMTERIWLGTEGEGLAQFATTAASTWLHGKGRTLWQLHQRRCMCVRKSRMFGWPVLDGGISHITRRKGKTGYYA